jgi:hydroxymethylpyrimidine/phosphomethylpyrimidine kinase
VALTIAGSDPSGGAGLQADLKTFHQHRVYGTSVVTLLTVQNTQTVVDVQPLDPAFVSAQLDAILDDLPPQAAKTGALGSAEIVEVVAERAAGFSFPLVIDPVMISKHGSRLISEDAAETLIRRLLPSASLVMPNLPEASALAGRSVRDPASMEDAARAIADLGARSVLIKGGHLEGQALDILFANGAVHTKHTHGTGCVYSAAVTARLAHGDEMTVAVERAKRFVSMAIETNPQLGHGYGPINMWAATSDFAEKGEHGDGA